MCIILFNYPHCFVNSYHSDGFVTYVRALAANFESHKKISRITFPIWLYVAVTGVIVYLMISPIMYTKKFNNRI
jgi:hypothetical protein